MKAKGIRKVRGGYFNSYFYYDDDEKFECATKCHSFEEAAFWLLYYADKFDKKYPGTEIYYTTKKQVIANKVKAAHRKYAIMLRKKKERAGETKDNKDAKGKKSTKSGQRNAHRVGGKKTR